MKSFKKAFYEACSFWMRKYPYMKISLKDIASLLNIAFSRKWRVKLAQPGFKYNDICRLNHIIFGDYSALPFAVDPAQNSIKSILTTEEFGVAPPTTVLIFPDPLKRSSS
ncbi:uncharacterized protein NPIL_124721 [Nephila pilipes]|uniref:Uncharacterized protein n=1 Tax=Nephila pilipes TaxID=299642 RepID=A0A8X6MJ57_NEPPI|nr:uncharacterized protein NPIL_124721 [Nephila pilipes]